MSNYKINPLLFCHNDGSPIYFSMKPSDERNRLAPFVEEGGGEFISQPTSDCIALANPYEEYLTEESASLYSSTFVEQCAKKNKLLDLYKFRLDNTIDSDEDSFQSMEYEFVGSALSPSLLQHQSAANVTTDEQTTIKQVLSQFTEPLARNEPIFDMDLSSSAFPLAQLLRRSIYRDSLRPKVQELLQKENESYTLEEKSLLLEYSMVHLERSK